MRKLVASMLFLAAVGGPVTVALAATNDAPSLRSSAAAVDRAPLALESRSLADRGEADARAAAAARRHEHARRATRHVRVPAALQAIAACESGGNPRAVGGGGAYGGKYQFSRATWASVGGSGDPAAAPEAEQDRRAAMLYTREGAGHWPVCGRG